MFDEPDSRDPAGPGSVRPSAYLQDKAACEELVFRSFELIDGGRASEVAELFTEDGAHVLEGQVFEGAEGLAAFFDGRQAMVERVTRHCVTNMRFSLTAEDRAELRYTSAVYVLSSPQPIPGAIADIHDAFVRRSGRWMFSSREVVIVAGGR
jgi:hypothetical protein